jgi:plastocyanin
MDGGIFFVFGGVLVVAALILAFVGIRGHESFPGSRPLLIVGTAVFAAVVVGTTAFAVVNAREEQDHREAELAEEEAVAEEDAGQQPSAPSPAGQPQAAGGGAQQQPAPPAAASSLDVSSPEDGSLVFEPDGLEANAGALTITYSNPSPVPHSIAVEATDGSVLGESQVFANGEQELTIEDLTPGEYVFFCTVPGHREGGMEGDLTVGG